MADGPNPIDVLESQLTALTDTQGNLGGLIEKAAGIQADLAESGFEELSEAMGEPFTALSMATEQLQALHHRIELERNRIRNEQ